MSKATYKNYFFFSPACNFLGIPDTELCTILIFFFLCLFFLSHLFHHYKIHTKQHLLNTTSISLP